MKILDKLKNTRIVAFFRSLRGQKALPEKSQILEEEDVIVEKSEHKKFVERINEDANDISKMTESEALKRIFKELGVKEDIVRNQEALQEIEDLSDIYIHKDEKMYERREEEFKTKLSKIVKDGRIEKVEEILTEDSVDRKTITIDVDEYGRLNIGKKSEYKRNVEKFLEMMHHDGKSENEALKESGYEFKVVHEHIIKDCGVELEKTYSTRENLHAKSKSKMNTVKITRNPDLVTAKVEVKDEQTNETRSVKNRWANPIEGGNQALLSGIEEGLIVTDINEIDRIEKEGEVFGDWCIGDISHKPEDEKNQLIENMKEKIKNSKYFKTFFEKIEKSEEIENDYGEKV